MTGYEELFSKIRAFAEKCDKIKAMVMFGSRARTEKPADEFSDYDLILFVDDVGYFAFGDEWLKEIAAPRISFTEQTAVQDIERRIFFDSAMDIDFILYNSADMKKIISDPIIKSWFGKGYRVIVDKCGCESIIDENKPFIKEARTFSEQEFNNTINIFWFHTIWAVKKLRRGEMWAAKNCIDGHLKNLLREILEYDAVIKNGISFDTWHDGRFFDQWADKTVTERLGSAYGSYDNDSLKTALQNTMNLFSEKAAAAAEALAFAYPEEAEKYAREQVNLLI